MVKQRAAMVVVVQVINLLMALQKTSRAFFDRVKSVSRAQTVACDAQCAIDKTRFARVGHTTQAIRKQVHTMLIDKSQNTDGTAANCFVNVEDVSTFS